MTRFGAVSLSRATRSTKHLVTTEGGDEIGLKRMGGDIQRSMRDFVVTLCFCFSLLPAARFGIQYAIEAERRRGKGEREREREGKREKMSLLKCVHHRHEERVPSQWFVTRENGFGS